MDSTTRSKIEVLINSFTLLSLMGGLTLDSVEVVSTEQFSIVGVFLKQSNVTWKVGDQSKQYDIPYSEWKKSSKLKGKAAMEQYKKQKEEKKGSGWLIGIPKRDGVGIDTVSRVNK